MQETTQCAHLFTSQIHLLDLEYSHTLSFIFQFSLGSGPNIHTRSGRVYRSSIIQGVSGLSSQTENLN